MNILNILTDIPLEKKTLLKRTKPSENKSLLLLRKPRFKFLNIRKKQSNKREVNKNEDFNHKHNPLLRNLRKLLGNLVDTDEDKSIEVKKTKYKRKKSSTDQNGMVCTCTRKSNGTAKFKSSKKAIATTTTIATEVPDAAETTTKATHNTTMANISSVRSNKDVPLLLSRDTIGSGGNDNGHSTGSSTTFHGSIEGNFTWDNGDSKRNTRIRENGPDTKSNEEDTGSNSRNNAGSHGLRRGNRSNARGSSNEKPTAGKNDELSKNKTDSKRHTNEFKGQDKFEARGNETESGVFISEHDWGLRGLLSENKISTNSESIQPKEDNEESHNGVSDDNTSHQRILDGSGAYTTETQDVSQELDTVISISDLSNLTLALQSPPRGNVPVVTIFGGYSVARDINGQNKLSEQSIHIHS